ncbi:MAG: hypothetical protein WDA16_09605 [Candidatus Thermoplasmatota archaeon]
MGFAVTAANVILAVAMLTAFSTAASSYWKNNSTLEEARRAMDARAVKSSHANITLSGVAWNSSALTEAFTISNTGTVGMDYTNFAYLIDGVYSTATQSAGYPKLNGVNPPTSDLLLPGDSLDVKFGLSSQPSSLQVISEYGIYAHYP